MYQSYIQRLLAKIEEKTDGQTIVALDLADLLLQDKSSIYKKISGKMYFSAEELLIISRHYNVSLDAGYLSGSESKFIFDYSVAPSKGYSPLSFLKKIRADLEKLVCLSNMRIVYATNEIPIFHSIAFRNLFAFKLYVWCKTNWSLPEFQNAPFDPDSFYAKWPELDEHRKAVAELYQKIPSKEFWPKSVLANILNQINYYSESDLMTTPNMAKILYAELGELLDSRAQLAASGHKNNGIASPDLAAASFDLYLNEIAYTNNIIMIYQEEKPFRAYITMDNPNFFYTSNSEFCQRMHLWLRKIEACSYHAGNEKHRNILFKALKQQLEYSRANEYPKPPIAVD